MLPIGTAWVWDGHVWFSISDPTKNGGFVLAVNLTTLDDECPDDECILSKADYQWIDANHPTAIAFTKKRILNAVNAKAAIDRGLVKQPTPNTVPLTTVQKVVKAALQSLELSEDEKDFVRPIVADAKKRK